MPSKKKKYNARFPAGRIKKIMQSDEEVGKVAQAVPVIISRTLELFVGSLLQKAMEITSAKNAKTLTPSHMKQCILSEQRFDFLKDLVKSVQDTTNGEDDMSGGPGLLVSGPNRSFPERRKSSCSSIKEETIIKEEMTLKEEPLEEYPEMPNSHKNFYSESVPEQIKQSSVIIKPETVTEPRANCSTHHFSPNFYSESVANQRQFIPVMKAENVQGTINHHKLPFSPNFYSESTPARLTKTEAIPEPLVNSSIIRYGPNFYSESVPEQKKTETITEPSHMMANCSTLRFGPNFYSETLPEEEVSIHRPPLRLSPSVAHQEPTRIAHLTMDEDYDT